VSEVATERPPAPLAPVHSRVASLVAAVAAGAVVARAGLSGWSFVEAATAALLVWVAAIDVETRLLPNRLIVPATALVLAASALLGPAAFAEHAIAMLAAGGLLLVAAAFRPRDLGMGDVKLTLLLGALLGRDVFLALAIGFCLVGVAGAVLLARHGRPALKRQLPLGPFLAAGTLAVVLVTGT
jgi:prepilin signal peptidase PulO-like enzyme (type II secretory pathway)